MTRDRTVEGYWHLPERPEAKVPGILRLGNSRHPHLELFGWLYPDTMPIPRHPDIILGESKKGLPVTLVDCFVMSGPTRRNGEIIGSLFGAVEAYLGRHYDGRDKIKTNHIRLMFSNHWLWAVPYPWKPRKFRDLLPDDRKLTHEVRLNKSRKLCQLPDMTITYTEIVLSRPVERHDALYVQPTIRMKTRRQKALDDFRMPIIALRAFLSLACRVPITLTDWQFTGHSRRYIRSWIEVANSSTPSETQIERSAFDDHARSVERSDAFFDAREISDSHKAALQKWMSELDTFFPVYLLFLEGLPRTGRTIDSMVLSLAQATEVFDGCAFPARRNFQQRVENITRKCVAPVLNYIGNVSAFAKKVKDIRNYYTHYESRSGGATQLFPFAIGDLSDTHYKLRLVLEVNLLLWAGFSPSDVEDYLREVWEYGRLF